MKKTITIILALSLICVVFVGCSKSKTVVDEENVDLITTETITEETTTESITEPLTEEITKETTEKTNASNKSSSSSSSSKSNGTNKKSSSSDSSNKKASSGKSNSNSDKSSNNKPKPTKPQTTKPVKHVNPKDVQNEVNNYIRSLGVKIDTSLRPNCSGWDGRISGTQESLDEGYTLRECKGYAKDLVDEVGKDNLDLYCYYENETFYILYMLHIH